MTAESPFHVGLVTTDVGATMATLGPLLGLSWVSLRRPAVQHSTPTGPIAPSSQVIWSKQGPPHIELVQAEPGTIYPTDRGTYVHHVGYWTADLLSSIAAYETQGWALEVTMRTPDGQPSAFAYLSRPGEMWIELIDQRNRNGLWAELNGAGPAP